MKAFPLAWIIPAVCFSLSSAAFLPGDGQSNNVVREAKRPAIRKLGTIDCDLVETTPVVFRGKLYRFEWVRAGYRKNTLHRDYFRLVEPDSGLPTEPFAEGYTFGSAYVESGTIYVTGTHKSREGDRIRMFRSRDMRRWDSSVVFDRPGYGIFNTSLCRAGRGYVLMFEIDKPADEAGVAFTARFLRSQDLRRWELTPPACNYARDRYTAPHCLRYLDGWFYDFYLEAHDGYETRVVRSRDLIRWDSSPLNPVLRASEDDRLILNPRLTEEERQRIAAARNINNSDIDFCEFEGRLIINYSWGNQQGIEFLAEAVYDGTEADFLRAWFPEASPAPDGLSQSGEELQAAFSLKFLSALSLYR
jgi:alpha-L-fucosidase